jgi:hypothetical protein
MRERTFGSYPIGILFRESELARAALQKGSLLQRHERPIVAA